jgi:competence protein ComFB
MIDVKNDMEHLVRLEVNRRKGDAKADRDLCWCALCEADVIALALNNLPPRYCRGDNFGYAAAQGFVGRVREAVRLALEKVSRRPKHRPGAPDRFRSEALLEDFGLKIGNSLVGSSFVDLEDACSCESCRADALALALNRYPPKYGVSSPGRASYQSNYEDFIRHELGQALLKARQVICAHPNH